MINKINLHTGYILQSPVDIDLLETLLQPEDATYPWNPADQESEAYFNELEQQFEFDDLLAENLITRTSDFYQNLDDIWSQVYHSKTDHDEQPAKGLQASLEGIFAGSVPASWLNAIAQKALEMINLEQSPSEKLVECVQSLLPTWGTDDLLVLARPFAYSMRSSEQQHLGSVINNIENRDWDSLSEIEQAKVSLAIADYALKQLSTLQT